MTRPAAGKPREKAKKVVGVGLATLDQLILWEDMQQPVAGNRIVDQDVQGGGMVGTAVVAVARLGAEAELWGAVGTDWAGDLILRGLTEEHVDVSQVTRAEGERGPLVIVCVDRPTGQRHFLYYHQVPEPDEPVGSLDRLRTAGCLLIDGTRHNSALRAVREANRLGVPVVGDVGAVDDAARELLAHMDYAIASEMCARRLGAGDDLRKACEMIRATGPPHVIITLGEAGLVWLDRDRFGRMGAFEVDVVDTTGAGDVFHGAFCYGLVKGFPLERNLAFASATAAMKCRKLGGRAGIPRRDEVEQFLAERGVDPP